MSETVIKCESVYKIFGENAKKMLEESNGNVDAKTFQEKGCICLLYTSPSPRDQRGSRMPSSA